MRGILRVELDCALQTLARVEPLGSGGQLVTRFELRNVLACRKRDQIGDTARRGERRERREQGERGDCGREASLQLGLPEGGTGVSGAEGVVPPSPPPPAPALPGAELVAAVLGVAPAGGSAASIA